MSLDYSNHNYFIIFFNDSFSSYFTFFIFLEVAYFIFFILVIALEIYQVYLTLQV